jgi:hypothetical protein
MRSISKNLALSLFFSIQIISISFGQNADSGTTNNTEFEPIKVLFIGNSYTYYYDLPELIVQINSGSKPKFKVEVKEIAKDGFTLSRHFNGGETLEVIRNGNWDYVVLQEQSVRPITNPKVFYEYIDKFNKEIKIAGAQTILFMTWAKEEQPETIEVISDTYLAAGEKNKTIVVPVGLAWETCRKEYPQIGLYDSDGSHPSLEGSYLTACVFYSVLTKQKPQKQLANINEKTTTTLQNIAWKTFLKIK